MLVKHEKYLDSYMPGDVYWGLGIENETYIEMSGGKAINADFINNRKRERYSVDYWSIYNKHLAEALAKYTLGDTIPLLMNAHSFTHTDRFGEATRTYTRSPQPNPKFCGTTLFEDLSGCEVFKEGYEKWWTFDGDTVEFITQKYYNAKMEDIVEELCEYKQRWLGALQLGLDGLNGKDELLERKVAFPEKNHGIAAFLTNRNNAGVFNNGTYHINITLPTYLDKDCQIADMPAFIKTHRAVARLFQWITPFLISRFGSGDVFSSVSAGFPKGSQRGCASRYVSVGTYDTCEMTPGKLLTVPYERVEQRWYEQRRSRKSRERS